jgi:hypothetical protein
LNASQQVDQELEDAWQLLNKSCYSELSLDKERPINTEDPLGKLAYFMEFGIYPPPELLLQITKIYESYIGQKGSKDLEESFYGKPIKGLGNYSGRKAKSRDVSFLDALLQVETKSSQFQVAEEYLSNIGSDEDPEHLLRKLRRHKAKCRDKGDGGYKN